MLPLTFCVFIFALLSLSIAFGLNSMFGIEFSMTFLGITALLLAIAYITQLILSFKVKELRKEIDKLEAILIKRKLNIITKKDKQ
jgi:hypothetical protein